MAKKLLIVESPAKAKTIEKFLGADFSVKSSFGHIRDLEKGSDLGVEVENNYMPRYIIPADKSKLVGELKAAAKNADEVWLATDEDREGEAISWHLCQVLGLDEHTTKRIVFHEITKPAIQKAVQNPRSLDLNLVDAQQARRVLDRLVGWELSGLLWKKVRGQLSAGRVQSVAVKLVVDREREIRDFHSKPYFKLTADFGVPNDAGKVVLLKAEAKERFDDPAGAEAFLNGCKGANYKVSNIEVKPTKRKPAPPFTTSTLQQEASRKFGYSVTRTMSIAQGLYEQGFITYMRTDSVTLSETALQNAQVAIEQRYGPRYHELRKFKNKNASAQEAHEAIRPTYFEKDVVSDKRDDQRLYELIWKRAIASQMADAELEKTVVDIDISTQKSVRLFAEGEVLKFDGFLKVYMESTDDEDEDAKGILPPLKVGQSLGLDKMLATERYTRGQARYTEAMLVKKLEELGIGRPSTYAPTISRIMEEKRGYVVKESREGEEREYLVVQLKADQVTKLKEKERTGVVKNALFPTDMGMLVSDFLDEHFKEIMEYGFTAEIEGQFDQIADGKQKWVKVIDQFYRPFHALVEKTIKEADRVSGERILGKDIESGRTMLVRMSSLGKPVVQIGTAEELLKDEKPKYANLRQGMSMDTVTYEDALSCFALPRDLGTFEDLELTVNAGRFGPYVKFGEAFISLAKADDPFEVSLERAIELILEKRNADKPIALYQGQPITKGKGRFGPFVKWGDYYANLPKSIPFDTMTEKQAIDLVIAKVEKESVRFIRQWPEQHISIERGRWGPFIRYKKSMCKILKIGEVKPDEEALATIAIEEIYKMIGEQVKGYKPGK
jgi:DNA topoisomerase I